MWAKDVDVIEKKVPIEPFPSFSARAKKKKKKKVRHNQITVYRKGQKWALNTEYRVQLGGRGRLRDKDTEGMLGMGVAYPGTKGPLTHASHCFLYYLITCKRKVKKTLLQGFRRETTPRDMEYLLGTRQFRLPKVAECHAKERQITIHVRVLRTLTSRVVFLFSQEEKRDKKSKGDQARIPAVWTVLGPGTHCESGRAHDTYWPGQAPSCFCPRLPTKMSK